MKLPTLFKRTSTGAVQTWTMEVEGARFRSISGQQGGKKTTHEWTTAVSKNLGMANESTPENQAAKEAKAEWDKKLKVGYTKDVGKVDEVTFRKPMKAYGWEEKSDKVVYPCTWQRKLNGIRARSYADCTRSNKWEIFHSVPHIREALAPIFAKWPKAFIDGEWWTPKLDELLNRMVKLVSVRYQPKDLTPKLLADSRKTVRLHLWDGFGFEGITSEMPWLARYEGTSALLKEFEPEFVFMLPYAVAKNLADLEKAMAENLKDKGEGIIVRFGECVHKEGKSPEMIKWKHKQDAEFEIVDIEEGTADWAGYAKRLIFKLHKPATTGETTTAAGIAGDRPYCKQLLKDRKKVIGKMGTIEWRGMSEYGIPLTPVLKVATRDYE